MLLENETVIDDIHSNDVKDSFMALHRIVVIGKIVVFSNKNTFLIFSNYIGTDESG